MAVADKIDGHGYSVDIMAEVDILLMYMCSSTLVVMDSIPDLI